MFNEDTRVKIPATIQFLRLGYNYQSLSDGIIDDETKIFKDIFKKQISKINEQYFSEEEIDNIISEILMKIKSNDLGESFYKWLTNPSGNVKLIDFDNIENNDFSVVNELSFGLTYDGSFRPDITVLINGIPLGFLEVKKPNNEGGIQSEFKRMINERLVKVEHKKYFNLLQLVAFSNNMEYEDDDETEDPRAGSFYATPNGFYTSFNFFREEQPKTEGFKEISDEKIESILVDNKYKACELQTPEFQTNLSLNTPCNRFVTSIFEPERLLYFIKYGIMYVDDKVKEKHIMRYPQFFASRAIVKRLDNGIKRGIVWHTQGSGKTALSAFSSRVITDYYAKRDINARLFFVVDRLDLMTQASLEFTNRGFHVTNASSRKDFAKELSKTLPTHLNSDAIGEFTVVNIHKFMGDLPEAKNEYNTNVQRIFFIDEAHRSYSMKGEFFKNLMLVDRDAVFIALTGTPLLSKKERSNLKFGDYIHKYFYDKSISDGYTLRIKKEMIDTAAKAEIKKNLEIEDKKASKKMIYESQEYVDSLGKFIQKDFENFRYVNQDKTIGGMIVCSSNNQAKMVHKWFEDNSIFTTGLVITDEAIPTQINKETQIAFKTTLVPDILVVHQMLTTGYDVKRLKKMYLLRNAKEHSLLQTISRVNRPYKNPDGKLYKYGYIVDFVDIEAEYDNAIKNYLEELEADLNDSDEHQSLEGLVVGPDEININYLSLKDQLEKTVRTDNIEEFSKELVKFDKDILYVIRRLISKIKDCHTEFLLSRADDYAKQIDILHIKRLLKEVQNRIDFVNLTTRTVDTLSVLSDKEVVNIFYEFIKTRITILDLGKFANIPEVDEIIDTIQQIQQKVKENQHKDDIKVVKLDALLKEIFERLDIADLNDLSSIRDDLLKALEEIEKINAENERLAAKYDGKYAFVKTYRDYCSNYPQYAPEDIEEVLVHVHEQVDDIANKNKLIIQGRSNFVTNVKKQTMMTFIKNGLFKKLELKNWYDLLLKDLYTNLQLYK